MAGDVTVYRRASVLRGRVVTRAGRGVSGVRVSTEDKNVGTTTSRKDGWFDLMVNGGGAVTLNLGRPVFQPKEVINRLLPVFLYCYFMILAFLKRRFNSPFRQ